MAPNNWESNWQLLHLPSWGCIMMMKPTVQTEWAIMQTKYKKWLINILIVIIVTVVMLALAEVGMRIIDGYQLTSIELEQDSGE